MIVKRVSFQNYRNLTTNEVTPSPGVNVICGDNAQGKTNFLEAMWVFTGGRSFRSAKDRELIAFGQQTAQLGLLAEVAEREQSFKVVLSGGRRTVHINKVPQQAASALVGKFCAVVFSPTHLALIKEGPGVRRKFLDTAICQMQPSYTKQFLRYNHILDQRNSLLRHLRKDNKLADTLDVWDEKLVECGAELMRRRFLYVEGLRPALEEFYGGLSAGCETIFLQYRPSAVRCACDNEQDLRTEFRRRLAEVRDEDLSQGFTTRGPHRDDLEIKIDGKSARQFSSQGQQRSAVLAMKLAEAELMRRVLGEPPVILMDDVLSELDATRQNYLLNSIAQRQFFITCCERDLGRKLAAGAVFSVSQGEIRKEN